MKSVRLWYKKSGLAIYTSHLDMNRCFIRAVRRAGIPLWYTEGFNPHPYLNFLVPLPLGTAGEREPIDIRIESDMPLDEIKDRMNAVLPGGIEITAVTLPEHKTNEITSARYEAELEFANDADAVKFAASARETVATGVLEAEKRSKRGIKTVNLCEFIDSFEVKSEGNTAVINACLATGTEKNLGASLLAEALCTACGTQAETVRIRRLDILLADGVSFK